MTTIPPHHGPDGTFRNPWASPGMRGFRDIIEWRRQRKKNGLPADPDPSVFPRVAPAFHFPRAPEDRLTATWIGHAATLLQIQGRNLLTDPMFGERASPIPFLGPRRWVPPGLAIAALPPIDAILISHNHYDHLDKGSVRKLAARFPDAPWIAPLGMAPLLRSAGARIVEELDWWESRSLLDLTVTATPARHFSRRTFWDSNRSLWCGFTIRGSNRSIYFAGDSAYHPEFAGIGERLGPFDLALIPIGAYDPDWIMKPVHMNPEEAVRAFLDLGQSNGTVMGAIHWGTFKLTDEPMDEPPRRARSAWEEEGLPPNGLWVPKHGETLQL